MILVFSLQKPSNPLGEMDPLESVDVYTFESLVVPVPFSTPYLISRRCLRLFVNQSETAIGQTLWG